MNVHPSLIPSFCGEGYYGLRVHEEALKRGVKVTGATVHFVNEICDGGPIILQKAVEVHAGRYAADVAEARHGAGGMETAAARRFAFLRKQACGGKRMCKNQGGRILNCYTIEQTLGSNAYPGRGILLGKSEDGINAVIAYFIMGRSENSRNRIFVEDGTGIRTEAFDPSKMSDPSLIIYSPVRVAGQRYHCDER